MVSIRPTHLNAGTPSSTAGNGSAAEAFKDAVFNLTSNPAAMEMSMKPVVDMLNQGSTNEDDINEIVETLFEQV